MDIARYTSATGKSTKVLFENRVFNSDAEFHAYLLNEKKFSEDIATQYIRRVRATRTLPLKAWNTLLKDKGLYMTRGSKHK